MNKKITGDDIKTALLEQAVNKGLTQDYYADLINDYMTMWVVKQRLINDIKERGVNIEYKNGRNQYGIKQNESVVNLTKINSQMLKILDQLGLQGAKVEENGKKKLPKL